MEKQEKIPEKKKKEIMKGIKCLSDNELKTLVIKRLIELENKINLSTDHFNRELGNIKKTQSKIHHSISESENTLKAINDTD